MSRCILCGKKINHKGNNFGLNCLKRSCNFIGINNVKNLKDEKKLQDKIEKLCGKSKLSNINKEYLTERYLTLKLLEEVHLDCYDFCRNELKKSIDDVGKVNKHDTNIISLKEAFQVYKIYNKFKSVINNAKNGKYDVGEELTFEIIRFSFNMYYLKKGYIKDINQLLQTYIFRVTAFGLKKSGKVFSAMCLNHSLQPNPKDLVIEDESIISIIKKDINFQEKIEDIINKNKYKKYIKEEDEVTFLDGDLFASLHKAKLLINGKREKNNWNLNIEISDKYDFTEYIKLRDYLFSEDNDLLKKIASAGNNVAIISTACKVISQYMITIKFIIEK